MFVYNAYRFFAVKGLCRIWNSEAKLGEKEKSDIMPFQAEDYATYEMSWQKCRLESH